MRADVFEYDKMGNRMGTHNIASRGSTNFARDNNGLNQYSSWTPSAINYDDDMGGGWGSPGHGNGVTMQEGWITASFNALNQPMAIWCPTYGTSFLWFGYDPLGRCVKRWMGSATGNAPNSNPATYYYYDNAEMVQEGGSATSVARIYVHGAGSDAIVASQVVSTGEWRYHHYDGQGNCILLTDTGGAIREQYDYDAFGMPYVYSAGGATLGAAAQWGNRFLFTGREWLSELRIYDYRARQYQPELGRFLQPDPQEFAAGDYNLYRYCHNDPVNKSDPTGLATDFMWDFARYGDSANTSQGTFAEFTHGAYMGDTGSSGSATVTGMPTTRQPNVAPKWDTPASDSTQSMKMTIATDPATGEQKFVNDGDAKLFSIQLTDAKGKAQDGRGYYAQEEVKVRVNQCSGSDYCQDGKFKVRTTNGKPLYELPRNGQVIDRVGQGYHPPPGMKGSVIKDQRWRLQHGTEHEVMLPGVIRQTTTVKDGKSYNGIAPTSIPW